MDTTEEISEHCPEMMVVIFLISTLISPPPQPPLAPLACPYSTVYIYILFFFPSLAKLLISFELGKM